MAKRLVLRTSKCGLRKITKAGCEVIRDMAAGGHSVSTIGQYLKLSRNTMYKIMERQPEVREAIEEGYSNLEFELVDRMKQNAMSADLKASNYAISFLLNNRCGYSSYKQPKHLTIINQDNRKQLLVAPQQSIEDYVNRWTQDGKDLAIPAERS